MGVSAQGLDHHRRGGPIIPFGEIKGLKGSRRRRWGSLFDQHSHQRKNRQFVPKYGGGGFLSIAYSKLGGIL
jgi:hypothetical protein